MAVELVLGKLSGSELLKVLIRDSRSTEISGPPVRVKIWGRRGVNAPYNAIVRQEVISDFLHDEIGLTPVQLHKTQVHILGEPPWNIPEDDRKNIFAPDENKRTSYVHSNFAWFNVDVTTGEHFLVVAAFNVWAGLKSDRQHFTDWWRRKRKNDRNWTALGKRTAHTDANNERRAVLEKATTKIEFEAALAGIVSTVGKTLTIEHTVHEIVHGVYDRRSDRIRFSKPRALRQKDKEEEAEADRRAEEIVSGGKWNHMLEFIVNPRRPRKRVA